MNKLKAVVIAGVALLGVITANVLCPRDLYARSGYVQDIDRGRDLVFIASSSGHRWVFEGAEDWEVGDWCACVFDGHHTPLVEDDEIVSVRYEAWR